MNLDEELIIETPERVELRYSLANIGNRFLAALIDHLIQALILVALVVTTGLISNWTMFSSASAWTHAVMVLAAFTVYWGYFAFFEAIWSGQTPGKRMMRLRVVREDGRPVRFFEVLVRNILRLPIDLFPWPSYAIGVVSIIFSKHSKRVGDFVAGTVVVKERATEAPSLNDIMKICELESARMQHAMAVPFRADTRLLDEKQLRAIEAFLKRRYELPESSRAQLAGRIASSVRARLGANLGELAPEDLIEEIQRQHSSNSHWSVTNHNPRKK
jgi:uncharacterized RDD family membrane protein YckC